MPYEVLNFNHYSTRQPRQDIRSLSLMDEFADIDEGIGTKLGLGFETSTQLSGNLT
jgi:hypothetical protein